MPSCENAAMFEREAPPGQVRSLLAACPPDLAGGPHLHRGRQGIHGWRVGSPRRLQPLLPREGEAAGVRRTTFRALHAAGMRPGG